MQTNNLVRKTENKKSKTIGRGGKRGKTSGRGHKGQWAHGSHGVRPEFRDLLKKFPKIRGHGKNRARTVNSGITRATALNMGVVDAAFDAGAKVNLSALLEKGLVKKSGGKNPVVKILAGGDVTKKLSFVGFEMSAAARAAIEKAGGTVQ